MQKGAVGAPPRLDGSGDALQGVPFDGRMSATAASLVPHILEYKKGALGRHRTRVIKITMAYLWQIAVSSCF